MRVEKEPNALKWLGLFPVQSENWFPSSLYLRCSSFPFSLLPTVSTLEKALYIFKISPERLSKSSMWTG